jgi:hypothetical protein
MLEISIDSFQMAADIVWCSKLARLFVLLYNVAATYTGNISTYNLVYKDK